MSVKNGRTVQIIKTALVPQSTRTIISRPAKNILVPPFRSYASKIATSSKVTLDDPLPLHPSSLSTSSFGYNPFPAPFALVPSSSSTSPRILLDIESATDSGTGPPSSADSASLATLVFHALEDELINALISPTRSAVDDPFSLSIPWTSSIDPALAYLGLRPGASFTPFLQSLRPHLRTVWHALRPSGLHQLLVSDLLLRNPDPLILAEILRLNAINHSKRWLQFHRLRTSLVYSIYSILPVSTRKSFDRQTNIVIAKALMVQGDTDMIPAIFTYLEHTTVHEPRGTWKLLELIHHLTLHHSVELALPLLNGLIKARHIPASALKVKGDASHSEAKTILVQSVILRTLLAWKYYTRANVVALDILDTMRRAPTIRIPDLDPELESAGVGTKSDVESGGDVESGVEVGAGTPLGSDLDSEPDWDTHPEPYRLKGSKFAIGAYSETGSEAVLETIRSAQAGSGTGTGSGTARVQGPLTAMLIELSWIPGSPTLPVELVDTHVLSLYPSTAVRFYFSLNPRTRPNVSPESILHLAKTRNPHMLRILIAQAKKLTYIDIGLGWKKEFLYKLNAFPIMAEILDEADELRRLWGLEDEGVEAFKVVGAKATAV